MPCQEHHGKQSVYWTVDDQNKAQVPDVDEEILSMGQSAETRKRHFVDVNAGGKLMSLQIDTGGDLQCVEEGRCAAWCCHSKRSQTSTPDLV